MDIKAELYRFDFEKMIKEIAKNLEGHIVPERIVSVEGEGSMSFPELPSNEDIAAYLEKPQTKVFITYALRYANEAIVSGDGIKINWSEEQDEMIQEGELSGEEEFEGDYDSIGITFTCENKILTIKMGAYIAEENTDSAEILDPNQDEIDIFDDNISDYVWKFMKKNSRALV